MINCSSLFSFLFAFLNQAEEVYLAETDLLSNYI